jgi:NAD(P)-dependent dehydrogenase (short-subunit alcohol dehydrogenase family)
MQGGHGLNPDMPDYSEFKGRNVLLTGGANGIGAATIRALVEQEARVFFCDREAKRGRAIARELGDAARFQPVELEKEEQIRRWVRSAGKEAGRIHGIVNNAAIDPRIPFATMKAAEWDRLFAVNLRAVFLGIREALTFMRDGEASIVNIASVTFHHGPPNMTAYVGTKGGVIGFTRSLARELGPRRIRVNVVSPGWVMTERQLREYVDATAKRIIRERQCITDRIQPEEIADVILFLLSDASRALTGQEILADHGWCYS